MARLADKFTRKRTEAQTESSAPSSAPANQNETGVRHYSLLLEKANGELWDLEYSLRLDVKLSADRKQIRIKFPHCTISIQGIGLLPLFHGIRLRKIELVQESHHRFHEEGQPLVTSISKLKRETADAEDCTDKAASTNEL